MKKKKWGITLKMKTANLQITGIWSDCRRADFVPPKKPVGVFNFVFIIYDPAPLQFFALSIIIDPLPILFQKGTTDVTWWCVLLSNT